MSDSEDEAVTVVEAEDVVPTAKRKCLNGGRFRPSWKLPDGIVASTKGERYAYCKLCMSHFSLLHGGLNDVSRHVKGPAHQQRLKDSRTTLKDMLGQSSSSQLSLARKVTTAEVMMSNFIAMHNLSFQCADHLSSLFGMMFPDSTIAANFSCRHTKTKAIICQALDPYHKKPVVESVRDSPFSLLCDESNEKGDSVKLLTILVRFYECDRGSVASHCHGSK